MNHTHHNTILVVDDDPQNRLVAVEQLMQASKDYKVLSAPSSDIALTLIERHPIDLLLLDWEMPGISGIDLLKKLKASKDHQQIPVIMYTGIMTAAQSLQMALDAGADDFLRKPADPTELRARVNSILLKENYFKQLLKAEQEKYNIKVQELSSTLLQMTERNQLLQEIKADLAEISPSTIRIRKVLLKLEKILNSQDNWANIKPRIESLHQGFIQQITQKHPSLTYNQIIFCALLRMGLHGKEIARILGISSDAIEKNRYRIRKKLQLTPEDKLEVYLAAIH